MPDPNDPVEIEEGKQEAYIVEMRSISGASGSPVFWYVPGHRGEPVHTERRGDLSGPLLLGIDCGHFSDEIPILEGKDEPHPRFYTKSNSGMAVVIPVWRIRQLLDKQEFVIARAEEDERRLAQAELND